MLRRLIFAALTLVAVPAAAQDTSCRNGFFPSEAPFALAEVSGGSRAFFYGDMNGCPWARGACSSPSYVVPGDEVLVSKVRNGFACALYPGKGGGTAGWVPLRQLRFTPITTYAPPSAWAGEWTPGDNPVIRFHEAAGALTVQGEAFWPGKPGTHDWPSIHVGEIDGPINLSGNRATYADDNLCEIEFTMVGSWLVAASNTNCGGANVSFSGVYKRIGE